MLVVEPTTYTAKSDTEADVSGFFEQAQNPYSAHVGGFDGTLNTATRQFIFHVRSPSDAWTFIGEVSPNGHVFDVAIRFEDGYVSDTFPLIHEPTFYELMPQ